MIIPYSSGGGEILENYLGAGMRGPIRREALKGLVVFSVAW